MTIRREFLASVGATVALAGCSGTQDTAGDETPTAAYTEDQPTNETDTGDQPTNETDTGEPQEVVTDFDLAIDTAEWFDEGAIAEFIVKNREDIAIQQLEFVVDWYDENGNYLDWDSVSVPALGPNKAWYLHVERSMDRLADSFEATARGIPQERNVPDGLEIRSSEVDDRGDVEGILSNTRDSEVGVNMVATVYDTGGWLTYVGSATQRRIPAGSDWRFFVRTQSVDALGPSPGDEIELFINQIGGSW